MTVSYGHCDVIPRRALWEGLARLANGITDDPWCVLGDFNAVTDVSEVCGRLADSSTAMAEFRDCIVATELVHLPFTGCSFTWHNCSAAEREASGKAKQSGFLNSVWSIWRHPIHGTRMYAVVTKLKALKPVFRRQRKQKGDLASNVQSAKLFLEKAQSLFDTHKEDILLQLVKLCQRIYCQAVQQELSMLKQRSKLNWLKDGDQCTRLFFRKINARRVRQRIYQINDESGVQLTDFSNSGRVFIIFSSFWVAIGCNAI
ncbi:UNVERIFIED_CONTAM: hypothetical protein Sradi_6924700 [Sesamum radiatum]|uniref:Endonuclease/exonuclease/phosphatase domain-containing protein n=1 Tax=Sesamum radiatum TaxID=300843 RepID=A0AAW2JHD3_SESRA